MLVFVIRVSGVRRENVLMHSMRRALKTDYLYSYFEVMKKTARACLLTRTILIFI